MIWLNLTQCMFTIHLLSIWAALLSSASFPSLFNIRMAEDEECVAGIRSELKEEPEKKEGIKSSETSSYRNSDHL